MILRRALVARNGLLDGGDAAAAALAWAWEHREQLPAMDNPLGYLYRVGQSSLRPARRFARRRAELVPDDLVAALPDADVDLFRALDRLTPEQRVSVVLVHMYRFRYREVADLLEISEAAVTNHVHRGLARLRRLLGASRTSTSRSTTGEGRSRTGNAAAGQTGGGRTATGRTDTNQTGAGRTTTSHRGTSQTTSSPTDTGPKGNDRSDTGRADTGRTTTSHRGTSQTTSSPIHTGPKGNDRSDTGRAGTGRITTGRRDTGRRDTDETRRPR